jgi:hypothetical protein
MDRELLTVEQFAALCGVTVADARAWLECVQLWMDKGYTFEGAVARHMAQMERMTFWANRLDPREVCVGLYEELRGEVA